MAGLPAYGQQEQLNMSLTAEERLFTSSGEVKLCLAWVLFWGVCHVAASVPSGALERAVAHDPESKLGSPRQRSAYLRRLCRSQVFCVLSLLGACRLILRWRRMPQDVFEDFTADHQVLFSMAFGHWVVSLWEDLKCSSFMAGGLDSKALPGVRDPSTLLRQGFLLHHLVAAASYVALLRLHRLGGVGALGLVFALPVLLLNRRELARVLGRQAPGSRWLFERDAVKEHWRFTYIFFWLARGGPLALYVYSVLWLQEALGELSTMEMLLYHGIACFFAGLNYAFLFVLEAWSRADCAAAAMPELVEEEDMDPVEEGAKELPAEPEAATLHEVDEEVFRSKANDGVLWLAVEGIVYDLTSWQELHPGGASILRQHAGRDATEAFHEECPASSMASLARYQVGALRLRPREYRIFEHPVEEQEMRRLMMAAVPSLLFGAICVQVFFQEALDFRQIDVQEWPEKAGASARRCVLPGLLVATGAGLLALLLPVRRRLAIASAGGWRAHVIALCLLLLHILLPCAAISSWTSLGPSAPRGPELLCASVLLLEILLAPVMSPPLLPVLLCILSWYDRGLQSSHLLDEGIYTPWRRCVASAAVLVVMTRLADDRGAFVRRALALLAVYAPLGLVAYLVLQTKAWEELAAVFDQPLRSSGILALASFASLVAHCALLDMAVRCSSRFATRSLALVFAFLGALCFGVSSWRWLFLLSVATHSLDLARQHRARLDQVAAAGRFADLPWHFLGAQALFDTWRVTALGYVWRATVCNLQHVITSIIPDELRVYACEAPLPYYGEKVSMGLAAQYVPPKARGKDRRRPNFFVCNVGQIIDSCMTDMQLTMNTLVDVWGEFHDPELPGLCANVVMVIPSAEQGLNKEINLSVWETGKDAFDWYVKSQGHKKALMQHTSGILRTFGNLLASLEPAQPIKYQDRCRRCGRTVEASPGQPAPSTCSVCGASSFRYNLF
mmetsp:Transcript_7459/g.17128  ORF Transcript_7459/g.17128 Transcript_7459/m.17128 type:complete len:961 (-) Transcript_7459:34-2916(-)